MKRTGFFDLQTPRDLLEKARSDLERFRNNPLDTYAAFDFFVTVRHFPDWLHPGEGGSLQRRALFADHVELRIARHIADGAKHFEATHGQNIQVEGVSVLSSVQADAGAFQAGAYQGRTLGIRLDPKDPDTVALGEWIGALALAERVLAIAESIIGNGNT